MAQLDMQWFITEDQLRNLLGYVFHPTDETNDDAISLIVQKIRKQPVTSAGKVLEELQQASAKILDVSVDEFKKMDLHEIESKLNIRNRCDLGESLYKFVSRAEYNRRTRSIDAELRAQAERERG